MLAKGLHQYALQTRPRWTDSRDVYEAMSRAPLTLPLVRGHKNGGVCRCSAVLMLVREGGVGLSF